MAAGIVNHGPGSPPVLGTEGIKRQAALLRTAIPELRATLYDQFGQHDRWSAGGPAAAPTPAR
jgi:hypothetical protein